MEREEVIKYLAKEANTVIPEDIVSILEDIPGMIAVSDKRFGDMEEPDGCAIRMVFPRNLSPERTGEYLLARALFGRLATDLGSTIVGNVIETISWQKTYCKKPSIDQRLALIRWEIPYLHYGS